MLDRTVLDNTLAAMFSNRTYNKDYLFYAHMIGQVSITLREDIDAPAGVNFQFDHYNMFINPKLFGKYTLVERLAILKHEMLHILYGHIERANGRNHEQWNISTDCALNQHINSNHLPQGAILPEKLGADTPKNESSEFYYEMLQDDSSQDDSSQDDSSQDDSSQDDSSQDDSSHSEWGKSRGDSELQKAITKKMIENATSETAKERGNIPNSINEWLDINTTKSVVNWKKLLRNVISNKKCNKRTTIHRRDRRFPKREDLRGKTKNRTFELLVIADVSGSMDDDSLAKTLGEVKHLCAGSSSVNLIQVDTVAHLPEKLESSTLRFNRKGNGGTELSAAIDVAKTEKINFDALVVLTDGYLSKDDVRCFTALKKKTIWLIEPSGCIMDEMNDKFSTAVKL